MKIATVFLVAVTVFTSLFLESSAAPPDVDLASVLNKAIENEKKAMAEVSITIEKIKAECSTDEQKENLAEVEEFINKYYPAYADKINKKLWQDIKDPKNREEIIIELLEAFFEVFVQLLKLKAKLIKTVEEVTQAVDKAFLRIIFPDTINYAKLLIKYRRQPTENSCASQQTSNEGIVETNNSGNEAFSLFLKSYINSFLTKLIAIEDEKIAEFKNIMEENIAKCSTDDQKEKLAKVDAFFQYCVELAADINEKLEKDVEDPKNRVTLIIEIAEFVVEIELRVQKLIDDLTETLEEVAQALKETFQDIILLNSLYYGDLLTKSLPTENSCASKQTLDERIAESAKTVGETIERVQNAINKATEDEKSGINIVYDWLVEIKLRVVATQAKVEAAAQGSSADRDAMAKELTTIIEVTDVEIVNFVNSTIPVSVNVLLFDLITPMRHAACVADQWSSA